MAWEHLLGENPFVSLRIYLSPPDGAVRWVRYINPKGVRGEGRGGKLSASRNN